MAKQALVEMQPREYIHDGHKWQSYIICVAPSAISIDCSRSQQHQQHQAELGTVLPFDTCAVTVLPNNTYVKDYIAKHQSYRDKLCAIVMWLQVSAHLVGSYTVACSSILSRLSSLPPGHSAVLDCEQRGNDP
eukprot:4864428-Pleurochrysis_carterae.AAC.2